MMAFKTHSIWLACKALRGSCSHALCHCIYLLLAAHYNPGALMKTTAAETTVFFLTFKLCQWFPGMTLRCFEIHLDVQRCEIATDYCSLYKQFSPVLKFYWPLFCHRWSPFSQAVMVTREEVNPSGPSRNKIDQWFTTLSNPYSRTNVTLSLTHNFFKRCLFDYILNLILCLNPLSSVFHHLSIMYSYSDCINFDLKSFFGGISQPLN